MWITTVKIDNANMIKSAFTDGQFSQDIKKRTSVIMKDNNAVLAIDGAAVGFNTNGRVITDRAIYRDSDFDCAPLIIKENGDLEIFEYGEKTAQEILDLVGIQTYDFGPTLIKDNEIRDNYGKLYRINNETHTVIAQKASLEYDILVADGRSNRTEGISLYYAVVKVRNRGCYIEHHLDS